MSKGEVYVCDHLNHRVVVFGLDGCFVRQWGTQGSGEGQFSYPFDVLVNGDEVLVTDYENHRVQVFDLEGLFVRQWGGEGDGAGQLIHPMRVMLRGRGVCDEHASGSSVSVSNLNLIYQRHAACHICEQHARSLSPPHSTYVHDHQTRYDH